MVVTLDLQGQTTAGNLNDLAPNRYKSLNTIYFKLLNYNSILWYFSLFVSDPTSDFAKPTYAAAFGLFDNYQKDVTVQDALTGDQLTEESNFLDAVLATNVIQQLRQFLVTKGTSL